MGLRVWLVTALCFGVVLGSGTPAQAEKRVALVIGNSAYPLWPLNNPVNDARAMAAKLKEIGFEVILRENATKAQMEDAIGSFGEKLTEGDTGLMFYAGHGMQVAGRNYLIPVDAKIASEQRVKLETVDAEVVLDQMAAAKARVSLVILDACRNNPFERRWRGGSAGLATMNAPRGTLIAYATAPGQVAADGEGKNGLYTGELLKVLGEPGLPVEEVFKRVRIAVAKASNEAQMPWEASSLTGAMYFVPQTATNQPPPSGGADKEALFWQSIQGSRNAADFEDYITQFPNGTFAGLARRRLEDMKGGKSTQTAVLPPPTAEDDSETSETVFRDCPNCPEMIVIPAGRFMMGSPESEPGRDPNEGPQHIVNIGYSFAVGKYEVTQDEYKAVMGSNPSEFKGSRNPVEHVSWDDTKKFIRKLNAKTGKSYRLLTEAEWEYVARAGTTSPYWWGDSASHEYANYGQDECCEGLASGKDRWVNTAPVGQFPANGLGVHDMHGNVWEWVEDCGTGNYHGAPTDGLAWIIEGCRVRVLRGGSWYYDPRNLRSARRSWDLPDHPSGGIGFRLARTLP